MTLQTPPPEAPILEVRDLTVAYEARGRRTVAVDGLSFHIAPGETVGLVGESGCGKSSLGKALLRLIDTAGGSIHLDGDEITGHGHRAMLPHRRRMQMVFQDPYGSLNPRQTVRRLIEGPLKAHGVADRAERRRRAEAVITQVGLPVAALDRFPHEFSGGQRQRISIAPAIILNPHLLICDEPVSALDVSVQAQILNLLVDLKARLGLSYLFISHDLSVVRWFADRIIVMYRGRIMETADHSTLWSDPRHPYTRTLLEAVPRPVPGTRHIAPIEEPEPAAAPDEGAGGCVFAGRCPCAEARCRSEMPKLRAFGNGHAAACHFA